MQNNQTEHNYIKILLESLDKKLTVLNQIEVWSTKQSEIINDEKFDFDEFDNTIQEKEKLINEINILDSGFDTVYKRVKDMLSENKDAYTEDISKLKELIKAIMDKSMDIQAKEQRNKESFSNRTQVLRKEVKVAKNTNKVAADYYQSMNKLNVIDPQFMDWKK